MGIDGWRGKEGGRAVLRLTRVRAAS